jgi:dTDP-4-dehydrorhamnose reductase
VIRALVTGARGQVGSALLPRLQGRAEIVAHDRASLDLADPDAIVACIREAKPHLILNAAAYTAVDRAESDIETARAVNGRAPGVLAEEAKRSGALLVHFSTDYVFDGAKSSPYVESDATHPLGAYGLTKLEGEEAVTASGCDHLTLRTCWVYSPAGRNFLLTMLRLAATQPEIRVVDDQHGAPTSAGRIADAVVALLLGAGGDRPVAAPDLARLRERSGLYHASAEGATTWFGFAQAIFEERSRRPGVAFTPPRVIAIGTRDYPTPARRPANSRLSSEKLARTFGVRLGDWRDGLRETMSALE